MALSDDSNGATRAGDARPLARAEKDALLARNRAHLEQDLWHGRLVFASRPRVVDLQLSNFCNMSCTMCYDGNNPPLEKLPEELVERLAAELLPSASVLVPFAGSEPLILTWELTRRLAARYDVELDLITNAQFLDERKFAELEPFVSTLTFSIDSHIPGVYERIRLRSRPAKVFRNLPVAAQLCRDHGIEPQANVVFMVENAAFLDETVAYLADAGMMAVRILQFIPTFLGPERAYSDPYAHLSPAWIDWMLRKVKRVAARKKIRLVLELPRHEELDFRPPDVKLRPNRKADHLLERLRRFYPGYCLQSVDRVKVHSNGDVYPCCVASGDELKLGNVTEQSFEEIWNGPTARDLRRAMLTLDLPEICRGCSFHSAWILDECAHLPCVDWFAGPQGPGEAAVPRERCELALEEPVHLRRTAERPMLRWRHGATPVDRYIVLLAAGGEQHPENRSYTVPGTQCTLEIPEEDWDALRPNMGYWWTVWGLRDAAPHAATRAATLRCLIRHEPRPRIAASGLYGARAAAEGPRPG